MITFTDSEPRVYCDIVVDGEVLVAQPGQSYDIPDPADGRWAPQAPQTAPQAPVAPATPDTTPTTSN
jgi:hypothetical protein